MKLGDVDWAYLRGALVMLAVGVLIGGGSLAGGYAFWDAQSSELTKTTRALSSARRRYQSIDEEERLIKDYLPRYEAWEARGVVGREYRLDWIEALRNAAEDLRLPELRYTIDSRGEYDPEFRVEMGTFQIYRTSMALTIGLLHEGDLLELLAYIDQTAKGLYTVSDCSIRRAGPEFGRDPTRANVNATCTLHWLTVAQQGSEAAS